ncbi:MAG: alpha/beta fold hydrolase [Minicystis sp.]
MLAAGCADPAADVTPLAADSSAVARAHHAPPAWGPCPADSGYTTDPDAECATLDMPLDHGDPGAGSFGFFVARKRSGKPHAPALWLLDGGPGSSGEELFAFYLVDEFATAMPDVDIYVPAHRGTGRSAGLFCSGEAHGTARDVELSPAEWQACIAEVTAQWGDKISLFNMTQAAEDLGDAIDRAHAPGQKVFVYGLSYGTTLALRYLDVRPHQADGVVLDSIASPGAVWLSQADTYFDPVLKRYGELCLLDATCASRMGPDPLAKLEATFTALDAGHCAEAGIDHALLRQIIAISLMGWSARPLALAVPYRLDRCTPEDVTALQTFLPFWFEPYDLYGFSHALESNIAFSEYWETPTPSPATLAARTESALASLDWTLERKDVYGAWPKYTPEIAPTVWPKTNVPMLMLNGTLDAETPIALAQLAAAHFHGPHQTFVALPNAPHGGGYQSPTTLPDGLPCGMKIMASFVADPHGHPDTSCIAAMKPLQFERPSFAALVFGTGSLWDNIPPPAAPPPPPPMEKHAARMLRRR